MWTLWLSEVESFSKLPSFFDIFSHDRSKEDVIYKLLTGELDEQDPVQLKHEKKKKQKAVPSKKMSKIEEKHVEMVKYCYDIVAQVFEKAKDNIELREECIENGTLEKFIERVGALTGEKKRVQKV